MTAFGDFHRGGSGPPLLLIHGFTGTWRAWGPVPALLEEQFDVVAPTVGGHTGGPELVDESLDGILEGLEAMLTELGWDRAHVAGWSMGGQLALELAVRGRAQSATALAPGGAASGGGMDRELRRLARLFRRDHSSAVRGARLVERLMATPRMRTVALRNQMIHGERVSPQEGAAMTRAFAGTPVFAPFLEALIVNDRRMEGLEGIDVPVTVAWGDTDRVLPQDRHEAFFRAHLPTHARFVTIKKAGHTPFWDAPERVANLIAQTALNAERRSQVV